MTGSRFAPITPLLAAVLLVVGLAVPAGAQSTEPAPEPQQGAEANLALELSFPNETPLVGDSVEVGLEVSSSGPEQASDVWVYGSLSDSFQVTRSDGCTSDPYGGVSCSLGSLDSGEKRSYDLEFKRVKAREAWGYFSVSSSNPDPDYADNYSEAYVEPDTSTPADLSVSLDADGHPEVGDEFDYEIDVANHGPDRANDTQLVDSIPYGVDVVSFESNDERDDCSIHEEGPYGVEPVDDGSGGSAQPSYVYRELRCELGTLEPDEVANIRLDVERNDPYQLWNSAWVSTSSYDANYENDYAYVSTDADPSVTSDLSTDIDGPAATPLLGDSFDVTFTVGNEGPAPVNDAALGAFLPDGVVLDSVNGQDDRVDCSANAFSGGGGTAEAGQVSTKPSEPEPAAPPQNEDGRVADPNYPIYYGGQGFNCALGSLAPGDSVDVVASLTRVKSREEWITGSAWSSNVDPDYEDNYAELEVDADKSHPADVGVKLSGPDDADVGDDVDFDIEVTNDGPMDARSVVVTDTLPYGLDYVSAEASDPSDECTVVEGGPYYETARPMADGGKEIAPIYWGYRQIRCELGTIDTGDTESVSLTATRSTDYEMSNSAYVETASYDSNYDNDYDFANLKGESPGPCPLQPEGTKSADNISVQDCPVQAGAGADTVVVQPRPSTRNVGVSAGKGPDSIVVDVPAGNSKTRNFKVKSGPGSDFVTIVVDPGATKATVVVDAGGGRDQITIDATHLAPGVRIVVIGGRGADVISPSPSTSVVDASWAHGFIMWGGFGDDMLTGAYANDQLHGGGGKDTIAGAGGADMIDGGPGKDVCGGGSGGDKLKSC